MKKKILIVTTGGTIAMKYDKNFGVLPNNELVEMCDNARREFYLRPNYIGGKVMQMFTQRGERTRILKASKTFFKYFFRIGEAK